MSGSPVLTCVTETGKEQEQDLCPNNEQQWGFSKMEQISLNTVNSVNTENLLKHELG